MRQVHRVHGRKVRSLYPTPPICGPEWSGSEERAAIIAALEDRGIDFDELAEAAKQPDADPFDLLCHVAFNAPIRSRRERAEAARLDGAGIFQSVYQRRPARCSTNCWTSTSSMATAQFQIPDILKVPPFPNTATSLRSLDFSAAQTASTPPSMKFKQLLYAA